MAAREGPSYTYEVFSQFRASEKPANLEPKSSTQTCAVQQVSVDLDFNVTKNRHVIYPEFLAGASSCSSTGSQDPPLIPEGRATGFMSKMKTGFRDLLKRDRSEAPSPRASGGRYRAFILDRVKRRHKNSESGAQSVEEAFEFEEYETEDEWTMLDVVPDEFVPVEHPVQTLPYPAEFSLSVSYDEVQRLRKIGSGAFGLVYRARYRDQLVALKEVASHHYDVNEGNKFINSLSGELRVLGAIGGHKNVLKCYGGSVTPPHVFMLCELMDTTLGELIYGQSQGPCALPLDRSLLILHDILSGLDHLHRWSPQIVHRDLKPDNILLDKRCHACVADFGLSRTKSHSYINTERTHAGTPEYLAPEVMSGKINEKMDIYSVGVILWECLMAERPWEGYHPFAILLSVSGGSRLPLPADMFPLQEPPGEFCAMYRVRKLIERCWDGNTSNRPSCSVLLEQLEDILLGIYTHP
eukprot:g5412.t1